MTGRLVSYSLSVPDSGVSAGIMRQLEISWTTLRRFNRHQPVVLFMHGQVPEPVARLSRSLDIMVDEGPAYQDRLAVSCPVGAEALATYPTLHKFLNFAQIAGSGARQVLCCDCDTIFAGDVDDLFERYATAADVVGREEMRSRRSPHGYDPSFIDEDAVAALGVATASTPLPPFNLGAVLLNDLDWSTVAAAQEQFIDLAWRFVTWMAVHPVVAGSEFVEFDGVTHALRDMTDRDVERQLPYPSTNRWILDEVCLWLALGQIPGLSYTDFSPDDVAQNGEFARSHPDAPGWTMCHYFSSSLPFVEQWLASAA